jgi:hypothetical protein
MSRSELSRPAVFDSPRALLVILGLLCLLATGEQGRVTMAHILLAALVSSVAGFGFSATCGAMLFDLHADHVQVVQLMITCSIASQTAMTSDGRRHINWPGLSIFRRSSCAGRHPTTEPVRSPVGCRDPRAAVPV